MTMNPFSLLFSKDKVVDGVMNGLDAVIHTDEEKAGLKLKFLAMYEPFKIGQRLLSMAIAVPYVGLHIIYSLVDLYFVISTGATVCEDLRKSNNDTLGEPFTWAVIFYLAGGAGEGIVKRFNKRAG